jgi:hypothetical protein
MSLHRLLSLRLWKNMSLHLLKNQYRILNQLEKYTTKEKIHMSHTIEVINRNQSTTIMKNMDTNMLLNLNNNQNQLLKQLMSQSRSTHQNLSQSRSTNQNLSQLSHLNHLLQSGSIKKALDLR